MRRKKTPRYIENKYDLKSIDINEMKNQIMKQIEIKESLSDRKFPPTMNKRIDSLGKEKIDTSFYTGTGGNIYLYWRQYLFYKKSPQTLQKFGAALKTNFQIINNSKKKTFSNSFFFGDSGIYLFACIYAIETKDNNLFKDCFTKLIELKNLNNSGELELEILYGIAGYLYSLLFLKKFLLSLNNSAPFSFSNESNLLDKVISEVFFNIIEAGIDIMERTKWNNCLLYPFPAHDRDSSFYLGAAHGLIGNIYMLLSAVKIYPNLFNIKNKKIEKKYGNLQNLLVSNINYIKSLQIEENGNFPDDVEGSDSGEKVHFCHGCVGAVHLFLLAEEIFSGNNYLEVAKNCNKCLWKKGLLYKGNGVCHGMSGICYALMKLYLKTNDILYLKEAVGICKGTFDSSVQNYVKEYVDPQRKAKGVPDTPYSLMEGDGGLLMMYYDLISMINGEKNDLIMVFPGYEIK